MKQPRRQALSLLEVLFVTGILSLFMTMVCYALVLGYRAHLRTVDKTQHYREATIALSRITREISTCNAWIAPPIFSNGPLAGPLELWRNNSTNNGAPATGVHVKYTFDAPSGELRLDDPSRPMGHKVVARGIKDIQVDVQDPEIKISLLVKDMYVPIVIVAQANQL